MRTLHSAFALTLLACFAAACTSTVTDAPTTGGACTGEGQLSIGVTGVPADLSARITITGPLVQRTVSSDTLVKLPAGEYTVTAEAVGDKDPIARKHYAATVTRPFVRACSNDANLERTDV